MEGDKPTIESTGGLASPSVTMPRDSNNWRWPSLCRMSNASVDLPDPDSPVMTTSWFLGISRVTFFRLCKRALRMVMVEFMASPDERGSVLRFTELYNPGGQVEGWRNEQRSTP